jgi:hypothetical protein
VADLTGTNIVMTSVYRRRESLHEGTFSHGAETVTTLARSVRNSDPCSCVNEMEEQC